jgi:hypothetical protein
MVNNFPKSQFGQVFDDYFWQRGQLQIENPSSYSKNKIEKKNRWIHILGGRNIRRVDHRAARRRLVGRLVGPTTRNYSTSWTYYVAALISRRVRLIKMGREATRLKKY